MKQFKVCILFILMSFSFQDCPTILGCIDCSQNQNTCTTCNNSIMFFMNNGLCVKFSSDINCRQINSIGGCTRCDLQFRLNAQGLCVAVLPVVNCLLYDNEAVSTVCVLCSFGYSLIALNTCVILVPNCGTYQINGNSCQICNQGYSTYNNGLNCVSTNNDPNCFSVDPVSGLCNQCFANFFFIAGKCRLIPQNC